MMKPGIKLFRIFSALLFAPFVFNCSGNSENSTGGKYLNGYSEDVLNSVLLSTDSLRTFPFVEARVDEIKKSLQLPHPVILCTDSLDADQQMAQIIALSEPSFIQYLRDQKSRLPYRNEIFGVYPARASDLQQNSNADLKNLYRVEMYNYALNLASVALVDIKAQKILSVNHLAKAQPDIPESLKKLAVQIAANSPEVQNALGFTPGDSDALMASTKTSLNRTRCERSNHLCVAPTFIKNDKALWAIVDLTDHRLVGIRWTHVGTTGPVVPLTERKLQDDKITSCYCEQEQTLTKNEWKMKYMLTSSDGLRIADVVYKNMPVLRSAKLVDWHVSYSGTDGFGYSDAVGCPYFSQAAVVAWEIPQISELVDEKNKVIGFVLEQTFRSEGWPAPCNYNYRQRYEFYHDGRFRVAGASLGRGCGNNGTYRPVFRIAFTGDQNNFYEWQNNNWVHWLQEKWNEQTAQTTFSPERYLYKISGEKNGYFIEPGGSRLKDRGKGDFSFVYVTKHNNTRDEGETDMVTIGPCCNTGYRQGPERFIEPEPENIKNSSLVVWYVAQLKNNDQKGNEYCWAESVLENGMYVTKSYPCFFGPMFIPVNRGK